MPTPEIQIIPPTPDRWPGQRDDLARLRAAIPGLVVHVLAADGARSEAAVVVLRAPTNVDPMEFMDMCARAMRPPGHPWTPPLPE
jgi:hypothetical protein